MPRVVTMNRKKNPIATAFGSPIRVATCVTGSTLPALPKAVPPGVVVGVGPADVDPGEEPGADDDQRPQQDAEGQSRYDQAGEEVFLEGDEENEAEIDRDHRGGQGHGDAPLGGRQGAQPLLLVL